ncbi:MFS-type transporter SLC18B1 isoform X5 [Dermacentor silvarum]|nr:MFS-type transporter SLC18B1 isoform X5 [Dermacentor silvarum]
MSAGFSLIQPFFPDVAISRGLSSWKYSFVFSAYKFGMLLGSILAERILKTWPPTSCYLLGQGGFFIFLVIFGCLYWIQDGDTLLATSLASVLFGGLANNMYLVGMFTVITTRFDENSGVFIGFLEFLWGAGNMAGSYLGGCLIDVWAYPLPFFILGVIAVATFPVIAKLRRQLEKNCENKQQALSEEEANINYLWLIADPVFFSDMVTLTMVWIILGFNEPTLEPSLTKFDLSSSETGIVYTVQYACYACGCIVAGVLSHFKCDAWCMVLGQCICTVGFLVMAPLPFISTERELWNVYACQILVGIGTSLLFICAYSHVLSHVMHRGYPNNFRTNSFVSSCVFSFLVIGAIVTPPVAGYIYDTFGYEKACLSLSCFLGAWIPVTLAVWIQTACKASGSTAITTAKQS